MLFYLPVGILILIAQEEHCLIEHSLCLGMYVNIFFCYFFE